MGQILVVKTSPGAPAICTSVFVFGSQIHSWFQLITNEYPCIQKVWIKGYSICLPHKRVPGLFVALSRPSLGSVNFWRINQWTGAFWICLSSFQINEADFKHVNYLKIIVLWLLMETWLWNVLSVCWSGSTCTGLSLLWCLEIACWVFMIIIRIPDLVYR